MTSILVTIAIRFALCSVLTWLVWWLGLGAGTVFMAGAFGIALAKPLLELAGALGHETRAAAWRPVQGRYYAFKQRPIDVVEDDDRQRWVRLADVREAVASCAHDATLQVSYPEGFRRNERGESYLLAEALAIHLGKDRSPAAGRFALWLERDVVLPGRRRRERAGIRTQARMRASKDVVE